MTSREDSPLRTLSVVVPVYNEERTIRAILSRVLEAPIPLHLEVIVVDDHSTDESWSIIEEISAADDRVVATRQPTNRGKGAAIRRGFELMTGEVCIIQDADLEYDPADIPKVIKPILDRRADAVFGSRFASSPERRVLFYWHSLGNRFLTWLFNILNDLNLTDMETCYKSMRVDVLRELRLTSDRFGIEPEISTRLAQWGARIYEVPISYHGRTYAEGKHIGWRDGVQALWLIFKFRFLDTEHSTSGEGSEVGLSSAKAYARWVMEVMDADLNGQVLELCGGSGNYTRFLMRSKSLTVVEGNRRRAEALRRRFARVPTVSIVEDLAAIANTDSMRFDTVLSFNCLATEGDPGAALGRVRRLMNADGRIHLLVPAHAELSSSIDSAMVGRSRFDRDELADLLERSGFGMIRIVEFNRLGVLAWRLNAAARRTSIGRWQARLFSMLVPVARAFDRLGIGRGLSFVVEARAS